MGEVFLWKFYKYHIQLNTHPEYYYIVQNICIFFQYISILTK